MTVEPNEEQFSSYLDWAINQKENLGKKFLKDGKVDPELEIPYLHLTHIGGSSIGALMGVSKYQTPADVYDKMTGAVDTSVPVHNFIFDRGHFCEKFIWQQAGKLLKADVKEGTIAVDGLRPWSVVQIDALVNSTIPLECKCISFNNSTEDGKEWGKGCVINDNGEILKEDDVIPVEYFLQCQKQMALTGCSFMYLCAWLTFEARVRLYVIHRDDELIERIKKVEDDFLFNNVIAGVRPETTKPLEEFAYDESKSVTADSRQTDLIERYRTLNAQIKDLKTEQDAIKKSIEDGMGDAHFLLDENGKKLASRTLVLSSRFDSTKFKNEHGEMYSQYLTESKSTRLTVTAGSKK